MVYDNHDCVSYSLILQVTIDRQSPIPNVVVYAINLAGHKIICEFVNFEN